MEKLTDILDALPVATIVHLIVTIVLGIDLLIDGHLSGDATAYLALVEGGNGLLAIGRGIKKRQVPLAPATTYVGNVAGYSSTSTSGTAE